MRIEEERIEYLKQETLCQPPYLAIDRMRILKDFYETQNDSCSQIVRAKALKSICEQIPLCIRDQELIVGTLGDNINIAQLYAPDSSIAWLREEVQHLANRKQDPFHIKEEDMQSLEDLIAYWNHKTLSDEVEAGINEEAKHYIQANVFFVQKELGYGHCLADYEYILNHGFSDIKKDIAARLKKESDAIKNAFYESQLIVVEAALIFIKRYRDYAAALADKESDVKRKEELYEIRDVCDKLVHKKAETFYEALQCVWFIQLIIHLESDGTGVSFGRLDQYLYPFYKTSIQRGEDSKTLQLLLDMFWIKTNHILKCRNQTSASLWSGYIMNQNVTVGGVDAYGNDASNEVTYMCLTSQEKLTMKEPQFSLRVHKLTPLSVMEKAVKCIQKGGGKPQFVSDKTIQKALMHMNVDADCVWDYAIIGCIEPSLRGGFNRCKSGHINLAKVLELAIYGGYDPITHIQVGPHTKKLYECDDFDDFFHAFEQQLSHMLNVLTTLHKEVTHELLQKKLPHPFLSLLTKGCLIQGKDITNFGARWNWTSFSVTGIANVSDSLYALQQELYIEKNSKPKILFDALAHDFVGYEELQQRLLAYPKYGNHHLEADAMASRCADALYKLKDIYKAHGETSISFGFVTVTKNVSMGKHTGALPDGRNAFVPFADGISPVHGKDVRGPLAVLYSTQALHLENATEGAILNQKFLPSLFQYEKARKEFIRMIFIYLTEMNGMHVQYNIVSRKTLVDAQKHPENYKELLVRVSGYSAYFVELSREVQQDVIERTQF